MHVIGALPADVAVATAVGAWRLRKPGITAGPFATRSRRDLALAAFLVWFALAQRRPDRPP